MQTRSGDFELTMDELRAIAVYAVACAEPALLLFQKACPDDPRPAAALHAARVFAEGAPRSRLQRTAAADAHRAARDATTEVARHAASAAGDAAAAAYLHPLAKATQVRHILGSAAHAARAAELARGDDPVVAEYVITAAAKRAMPVVLDVLTRYPRAPKGRTRVAVLMERVAGTCEKVGRAYEDIEKTLSTRMQPGESPDAFARRCSEIAALGIEHIVVIVAGPWTDDAVASVAAAARRC